MLDLTHRGLRDLRDGVLRTPLDPAETFAEDPLRMFRGARFVAQLGFTLADGIVDAMRAQAHRAAILSVERISEELRRLLASRNPREGVDTLRAGGLLERVLPEVEAMVGVEQGGFHIYDVYEHSLRTVALTAARDTVTRWGALLHDVGKPATHALAADGRHTFYNHPHVGAEMVRAILARLRFSNDEIESVARLVQLHLRPIQYERDAFSDTAVRRLITDSGDLRERMLDIARADTLASSFPSIEAIDELAARMARLDTGGEVSHLRAALDGDEIMAMAGRSAGPWVGRVKRRLEDAVIDGELPAGDAEAARAWLQSHPELLSGE